MMAELPAAYSALAAQRAPQLPPLAASFVDFAMWERGRLEEGGPLASQACPGSADICCRWRLQTLKSMRERFRGCLLSMRRVQARLVVQAVRLHSGLRRKINLQGM